ncbi:hypothetical protein B9G69_007635 [Bdellovibrio sp. SKB1291214]|uniref:hypothetical protein n=1 Tax=Bdellovibrio sp. SKB1291214 TaxID=1732569 RepID=UPI000B51D0F3|nr:hypothetical protein [Bdellovibrio sp. SKB1291214]UYL10450.1 hypothetical protein B9G69_007635 [Bdellovibrio sp. SKB1291214]
MKNILLLAVIALIGTAAHAQSAPGAASDAKNDQEARTTQSETTGRAVEIGCPGGGCLKHLSEAGILDKTAAQPRSGGSGSSGSETSQGQGGAQ